MKTIARERELGLHGESPKTETAAPVKAKKAATKTKKEAR